MRATIFLSCIAIAIVIATVSKSRGEGDTNADENQQTDEPETFGLGPNPIPYELQPTEEQDNIDRVAETFDLTHPDESSDAWARAADQSLVAAQAEIASRHVGLEGVEDQGVVP